MARVAKAQRGPALKNPGRAKVDFGSTGEGEAAAQMGKAVAGVGRELGHVSKTEIGFERRLEEERKAEEQKNSFYDTTSKYKEKSDAIRDQGRMSMDREGKVEGMDYDEWVKKKLGKERKRIEESIKDPKVKSRFKSDMDRFDNSLYRQEKNFRINETRKNRKNLRRTEGVMGMEDRAYRAKSFEEANDNLKMEMNFNDSISGDKPGAYIHELEKENLDKEFSRAAGKGYLNSLMDRSTEAGSSTLDQGIGLLDKALKEKRGGYMKSAETHDMFSHFSDIELENFKNKFEIQKSNLKKRSRKASKKWYDAYRRSKRQ